jgi:hypothetical protein
MNSECGKPNSQPLIKSRRGKDCPFLIERAAVTAACSRLFEKIV